MYELGITLDQFQSQCFAFRSCSTNAFADYVHMFAEGQMTIRIII